MNNTPAHRSTEVTEAQHYDLLMEAWRTNTNLPAVVGWTAMDADTTLAVMEALLAERFEQDAEAAVWVEQTLVPALERAAGVA